MNHFRVLSGQNCAYISRTKFIFIFCHSGGETRTSKQRRNSRFVYPGIIIQNATATRTTRRQTRLFSITIKVSEYIGVSFNGLWRSVIKTMAIYRSKYFRREVLKGAPQVINIGSAV